MSCDVKRYVPRSATIRVIPKLIAASYLDISLLGNKKVSVG